VEGELQAGVLAGLQVYPVHMKAAHHKLLELKLPK